MRRLLYFVALLFIGIGAIAQTPTTDCLGEPGTVQWRMYGDVRGVAFNDMTAEPHYPQSPTVTKTVHAIQSPLNYYEQFLGTMQGFLRAPETGYYTFNLTGDDYSRFQFTLEGAGDTLTTLAEFNGWTGQYEHDKYDTQTSDPVYLQAGNYYYFWIGYKEGGGRDHGSVFWRRPSMPDSADWELIHSEYIYEDACLVTCLPAGTPCDDGDPNTTNDQEDGNCHCLGIPDTLLNDPCVGPAGSVQALYYDSIYSRYIDDLLAAEHFPGAPSHSEPLEELRGPLNRDDNYGTRLRAWLRPPESGFYSFNVTGEHQVRLYLGYHDSLSYDQMEIARLDDESERTEFEEEPGQTSDPIWLIQDRLYYIEVLHQDNWGWDFFSVQWKTPFSTSGDWQVLDGHYLHAYRCETACVPEGTACDDGNPLTFDDQYNADCQCAGTPCIDENCSNNQDYIPYASCADEGTHSNQPEDSWTSCSPEPSPNTARGTSHWIEYDLGDMYLLDNLHIWNYNATNATQKGFKTVAIDYSLDGSVWMEAGIFTWNEATGQPDYTGFDMDALAGIGARYLLFTALDNYGDDCSGLAEVQFDVFQCPDAGTACDDGDPFTANDQYNEWCTCEGSPELANNCTTEDTIITGTIAYGRHTAQTTIIADGKLAPGSKTVLIAGERIIFKPGFETGPNSELQALIMECETPDYPTTPVPVPQPNPEEPMVDITPHQPIGKIGLRVQPNPALSNSRIAFTVPKPGNYSLDIRTVSGRLVQTLSRDQFLPKGQHEKELNVQRLAAGVYFVHFTFEGQKMTERLIVLKP